MADQRVRRAADGGALNTLRALWRRKDIALVVGGMAALSLLGYALAIYLAVLP